ncbi:hypothetical protein SDRG_10585 [Saprolegnia diclina VS20]|uniref:Transmembrane protein 198 n=1 Tax=Saprolegnia diclina (strain VS20) TaxID=1156394 RepID=T0QAU2_SAPDV|nr:hypothetical protein SDRG_10585 [Saprolegnia diclina VS20]EQC31796.1 hypothetical protein SDRG_10585 [Saprolegnia diclina VS20]|eukprot:XP_008614803.1 hypothetical protein SDRG_10585 [Saprolegnia diclina VS20]
MRLDALALGLLAHVVAADTTESAVTLVLSYVVRAVSLRSPTVPTPSPSPPESSLDLLLNYHYSHIWSGLLAGFAIPIGLVLAFLGFKMLKVSALLCGFSLGGLLLYVLSLLIFADQSYIVTATWVAFLIGALLIGAISMLLDQVGNFVIGLCAGAAFAALQHISYGYKYWPSNPNGALYISVASWALVFGALTVLGGKPLQIVSTSLAGATMTVWGIGYFAGRYPSVCDLPRQQAFGNGPWEYDIPSAWWGYLTATLVLWVAGIGLQFAVTAVDPVVVKKEDHHATHDATHHRELYAHHHLSPYRKSRSQRKSSFSSSSSSSDHHAIEMTERRHQTDKVDHPKTDKHRTSSHEASSIPDGVPIVETHYVQVGTPHHHHDHHRHHHF